MEDNIEWMTWLLTIGTVIGLMILAVIASHLGKIAKRMGKPRVRIQRTIWKSPDFDFKNLADCQVFRTCDDAPTDEEISGWECVAVIHTDRVDDDDKQIVETVYAMLRDEEEADE